MPDPSGWRGNSLNTSFKSDKKSNGPSDNLQAPVRTAPSAPVRYVAVPGGYGIVPYGTVGMRANSGVTVAPVQPQQSQGQRANDFSTPQGRSESNGISQAWQSIVNPYNPRPMADQTRNPSSFSFGGQRANNGGQTQSAAITKILDRLAPYGGVTPPPQYTPSRDRTNAKVYTDRVPSDQIAEGYEPYQGDSQGQSETAMGVKYEPYQVPDLWTKPPAQQTAQMQNYPMLPLPAMPGGIGVQPYGNASFSGQEMIDAIGSDAESFTGGGLLGDGVYMPAVADRPDIYQPTQSPMFQRGMAAVDKGMNAIKAPMQKADDWLGEKFPGLYNADKGNPNPNNNDRSYPWNEPRLSGKDQAAYNALTPTQRNSVAGFMAQGMSYDNAVKAAGIKKKKSSTSTSNSGTKTAANPYNAANWFYPRYTQTWAGPPKGRGNV